ELLDRLADDARSVPAGTLRACLAAMAGLPPESVRPPERVRVSPDLVLLHDDVVVVDEPHHLQLAWEHPPLVLPLAWAGALADVLDVARSSELVEARVDGGAVRDVPAVVGQVLDGVVPGTWREHDALTVGGRDVSWWVTEDGGVHASTVEGLARGLAWAAGRWDARLLVAAVLAEPDRVDELLAEGALQD
ncbi:MAG: hypothetical protein ACRDWY_07445, partial [Actinomycetes bacterium]